MDGAVLHLSMVFIFDLVYVFRYTPLLVVGVRFFLTNIFGPAMLILQTAHPLNFLNIFLNINGVRFVMIPNIKTKILNLLLLALIIPDSANIPLIMPIILIVIIMMITILVVYQASLLLVTGSVAYYILIS